MAREQRRDEAARDGATRDMSALRVKTGAQAALLAFVLCRAADIC